MVYTTLLYAGLLGLVMAALSIRVPARRAKLNAPWGDAEDLALSTRIRVFGNFTEYVPYLLLLMAVIEVSGGNTSFLHLAGVTLLLCRVTHAISLKRGDDGMVRKIGRGIGAMGTWVTLFGLSGYALVLFAGR